MTVKSLTTAGEHTHCEVKPRAGDVKQVDEPLGPMLKKCTLSDLKWQPTTVTTEKRLPSDSHLNKNKVRLI